MNVRAAIALVVMVAPALLGLAGREGSPGKQKGTEDVTYAKHVAPIIKKYCLPCHAEEAFNPSKLALDSYALLKKGGKHGSPVEPGKPQESMLLQKLEADPPFGDRMPLQSRRDKKAGIVKKLTQEEEETLRVWITQGAKDN